MGRHNKNGRPVAGGGRDPTDGKDRLRFYAVASHHASKIGGIDGLSRS